MRLHSADLAGVVTLGGFTRELVGDIYYGPTRLLQDVPIDDWALTGDYDAKIKTSGSCTIIYQDDLARSYTPREATDALAAYGQELHLWMVISAAGFTERVRVGVYRIDDVPSAYDRSIQHGDRTLTVGSVVRLQLLDRFTNLDWPTRALEQPAQLSSAWAELVRLSRLQGTRTVVDVPIPNTVVYPRNRLEAVQQLAGLLGGRAYMRSDGTIGVIPDQLDTPVLTYGRGEPDGTIIGTGYSMTSSALRNVAVGDFEDDQGNAIRAEASITSGPLAVDGPFGERVDLYPDDQKQFIRTQAAANTAVKNRLALISNRGPVEIPITITPDPRPEIGDVVQIDRPDYAGGATTGRIVKYSLARKGPMSLTVRTG